MVESAAQSSVNSYKDYKFVALQQFSPSFLMNNLTTDGGEHIVFANTADNQPKAIFYGKDIMERTEAVAPQIFQWKDQADCFQLRYLKVDGKWVLAICTSKGCQIWNQNATRQLTSVESKKKMAAGKINFFTCSSVAIDRSNNEEFIAVGTCTGEIYAVICDQGSYTKEMAFQMSDQSAITAMSEDAKSRTLAVGNSNGYVIIFECDNQKEWKPAFSIQTKDEIPVTSIETLIRSENLYVIGLANGSVKIAQSTGAIVAELSSHSRSLNALVCHPSKPIFATCSDDTFMNVFEVKGDKPERCDVKSLYEQIAIFERILTYYQVQR